MYCQKIKYIDFNGSEREEELFFNLTKPEIFRLQRKLKTNDITKYIDEVLLSKDINKIIAVLEEIILSSYGEKTEDGRSFEKTETIRNKFSYSQAYAELFDMLINDSEVGRKFVSGVTAPNKRSVYMDNITELKRASMPNEE